MKVRPAIEGEKAVLSPQSSVLSPHGHRHRHHYCHRHCHRHRNRHIHRHHHCHRHRHRHHWHHPLIKEISTVTANAIEQESKRNQDQNFQMALIFTCNILY